MATSATPEPTDISLMSAVTTTINTMKKGGGVTALQRMQKKRTQTGDVYLVSGEATLWDIKSQNPHKVLNYNGENGGPDRD